MDATGGYSIDVLFVCTAGRCRSPVAAALLDSYARTTGMRLTAHSGGLQGAHGAMPRAGVSVLLERGIDLRGHRSMPVRRSVLADADLVLGMAREHVRELVAYHPQGWTKTFTLHDFVQRAELAAPRGRHQRLRDWLEQVGDGRSRGDLLDERPDHDIADPYGQRAKVWRTVVEEIDALVVALLPLLHGRRVTA